MASREVDGIMKGLRVLRNGMVAAVLLLCSTAVRAQTSVDAFAALRYRSIGPAIAGGRVTAVAGSDRNPLLYYAGGADGGIFKTIDGGMSWRPIFDSAPVAAIGAIAVSARDERDVWVGTGEANPRNDAALGDGLWHSRDGGRTWIHTSLPETASISSILLDASDPRRVIVGAQGDPFRDDTKRGVYVSDDGGVHWKRTLYVGRASGVSDLARDREHTNVIFAGVWQVRRTPWSLSSGGPLGGIFRSDDDGYHWRRLTGHGLPNGLTGRIGLATATHHRIYAMIQSREGALWRSDDDGNTWKVMPHDPLIGHRPFYFSRIFADPTNANLVINLATYMSLSTNAGVSFHQISVNAGYDNHSLWWSSDGRRIINGNDTGVIISTDGGTNWVQPHDLPVSEVYHVGIITGEQSGYMVCVGLQDVNSWCGPANTYNGVGVLNRDWKMIAPGDGMWSEFDAKDPETVWSSESNRGSGQIYLTFVPGRQSFEISPYKRDSNGEAASQLKYRFNWDTPIAVAWDTTLVGGNVIFATNDRGHTWTVMSPDLTRDDKGRQQPSGGPITLDESGAEVYDTILDIAFASGVTAYYVPSDIWVSTDDGLVQLTRDGGRTWKDVTPRDAPQWGRIPTVQPSKFVAGRAYIVVDRHMSGDTSPYVYLTDDYGATWRSISSNLPSNLFARVIREDFHDPNLLYLGTQRGIWVSFDRGAHWSSMRLNMPATAIYDIEIQPNTYDLVVGTHGRGVWILDDLTPLQHFAESAAPVRLWEPRPVAREFLWSPVIALDPSDPLPHNDFVGANHPYGALISYYLAQPAPNAPKIDVIDGSGKIIRHLHNLPNRRGVNRTTWDLNEDGPVQLQHTFAFNRGPDEGPEVLPGQYTLRLTAGGTVVTQIAEVLHGGYEITTDNDKAARYAFLTELYSAISKIDEMLNTIQARLPTSSPANTAALEALEARLIANPQNELESLSKPPELRERYLAEIGRVSSSFQPPMQSDLDEVSNLHAQLQACITTYDSLIGERK